MKTCPHCGADNPSENAACCNCFASLDTGSTVVRSSTPKAQPKAKPVERPRNTKVKSGGGGGAKALVFLLVLAILGGGGFVGYNFFLKPTPEKTIAQLSQGLKNQDIDMCIDCLSSETQNLINQVGILPLVKKGMEQVKAATPAGTESGGKYAMKVDAVEYVDADHAVVTTTADVKMPNIGGMPVQVPGMGAQQQQTSKIPMIKEDGKWKIDGIKAIDDGMRSLKTEQVKSFAGYLKLGEQMKSALAMGSPELAGINLQPITQIANRELQRRGINPNSIKAPSNPFAGMPMNMPNMPR